jgi:methyltransferase-like protein
MVTHACPFTDNSVQDFEACARNGALSLATGNVRTLEQHCEFMVVFLNEIVENLDNSSRMKAMLQDYGEKHGNLCQRYELTGDMWEVFGVALLQSIVARDGVKELKVTHNGGACIKRVFRSR